MGEVERSDPVLVPTAIRPVVFVARGLTKTYRMGEVEVRALAGVDLEIREGEFIVLLGPSGSGKSTLLNILGGLDTPSAGSALWRNSRAIVASTSGSCSSSTT
jgi:putative ABC transport system ATP-binding protein